MSDWVAWHEAYDDPASPRARRLDVVRRLVGEALADGARRVVSLCAGDGRDLLPLLRESRHEVTARLVELDPELAERARAAAVPGVEVVCGDAARTDSYAGAVPADLVVACGIFGNVSDADVERTIGALPGFCAPGGVVIWTRHRRAPDLTPAVRRWFAEAGFEELVFESPGPGAWAVGMHRLAAPPRPLEPGRTLFAFVG